MTSIAWIISETLKNLTALNHRSRRVNFVGGNEAVSVKLFTQEQ